MANPFLLDHDLPEDDDELDCDLVHKRVRALVKQHKIKGPSHFSMKVAVLDRLDQVACEGTFTFVYGDFELTVTNPTWLDLWRVSARAIKETDDDSIYIESIECNLDKMELELNTGS